MKWSIRMMTAIVVFLIAGSIMMSTKLYENIFRSPVSLALLGAFTIMLTVCSLRYGFSFKKIAFQFCHLGIVIILIGAGTGYFTAVKATAVFPMNTAYNQLQLENNDVVTLGFTVSVTDFQVERYNPDYYLLKPLKANTESNDLKDYQNLGIIKSTFDGRYDLKGYGIIDAQMLRDSTAKDGWRSKYVLKDGLVMVKAVPKDKHYLAKLKFIDNNNREIIEDLEVNHPVEYSGWKFYLSSYDTVENSYVVLAAKHDPGAVFVIYGMWLALLGTVMLCLQKRDYLQGGETNE